jgi:hypothetical protein
MMPVFRPFWTACTMRSKHLMSCAPFTAVSTFVALAVKLIVVCMSLTASIPARASIEDEYARKLMSLSRKSLGSQEMGTLKTSLDTVRGELESIAKQHQNVAAQMKSELEEPLAAFAGALKERRKIVQHTVEKLLKIKVQQTQAVNKVSAS